MAEAAARHVVIVGASFAGTRTAQSLRALVTPAPSPSSVERTDGSKEASGWPLYHEAKLRAAIIPSSSYSRSGEQKDGSLFVSALVRSNAPREPSAPTGWETPDKRPAQVCEGEGFLLHGLALKFL
jgi:hypothetical protein